MLLSDTSKFIHLAANEVNLNIIEAEINSLTQELLQTEALHTTEAWSIKARGSVLPRLYGLPKIHKLSNNHTVPANLPMRPVLSMTNSPYHGLAKWLNALLTPLRNGLCRFNVKDSFEFASSVRDIDLSQFKMLSFDVVSLFTNIPLEETIEFICEEVSVSFPDFPLHIDLLRRCLRKCTSGIPFICNAKYYRQIDGVAMGSPLGPLLADIFMAKLERNQMSELISNFAYYVRFVDDTFVLCNERASTRQILKQLNQCHPAIKFTVEEEVNDALSFLDVSVLRNRNDIATTRLHFKPTWSGQYINFYSFVPMTVKRNLVSNLANRVCMISNTEFKRADWDIIAKALSSNGYPKSFIEHNSKVWPRNPMNETDAEEPRKVLLRLQFRGEAAAQLLKRRIERTLHTNCHNVKLRPVFTSRTLIPTQTKDLLPVMSTPNVVYQFTCNICQKRYIGVTARRMLERVKEHIPKWIMRQLDGIPRSSVAEHIVSEGHWCDRDSSFEIIHKARHRNMLKYVEAVAIKQLKPELNIQHDFDYRLRLWS